MNLEGKRIVVTGGSRGLGLGLVEALVRQHAHITVVIAVFEGEVRAVCRGRRRDTVVA